MAKQRGKTKRKSKHSKLGKLITVNQPVIVKQSGNLPVHTTVSSSRSQLGQAKTRWLFNEWSQLTALTLGEIEADSQRERLALLIASAHQYQGTHDQARSWARQALAWGCEPKAVAQALVSGMHNTLGRIAILENDEQRVSEHFEASVAVMQLKDTDTNTLVRARILHEANSLQKLSSDQQEDKKALGEEQKLSRSDIVNGFQFILGREPENEQVITEHQALETMEELRKALLESNEFSVKYSRYYRHTKQNNVLNIDTPRVIFMHLPKTGGSTMHRLLSHNFVKDKICPERWNYLRGYTLGDLEKYRLFSGHFDYYTCQMIPGKNNKIITILREPKARLISLYYFERAHRTRVIEQEHLRLAELANKYSLVDFFKLDEVQNHNSIKNTMVNALVGGIQQGRWEHCVSENKEKFLQNDMSDNEKLEKAKANLASMSAFGILEFFEESSDYLFNVLELEMPEVFKVENKLTEVMNTNPGLKPVVQKLVTTDADKILDGLTYLDKELYDYAVNLFKIRLACF